MNHSGVKYKMHLGITRGRDATKQGGSKTEKRKNNVEIRKSNPRVHQSKYQKCICKPLSEQILPRNVPF